MLGKGKLALLKGVGVSHFDDLFWLVEVVDAGTLSAAAEKHHVTSAAVSKRLRLLEERLGVKLLIRNTRHLRTTEAGALYYQRGKVLLDEFKDLEDSIASTSEHLHGSIRINAPLSFGLRELAAPLSAFMQQYPQLNISLHLDDRFIDILNSDYDLVIRIGTLDDSSVVAQRIASTDILCCASPDYLARHGTPQTLQDLQQHNCLVYQNYAPLAEWVFIQQGERFPVTVKGNLASNNGDMLCQAAILHQGIVLEPEFIVRDALRAGQLVRVLPDYSPEPVNVYAMYPTRHFLPMKIKRLVEFLRGSLG